MDPRTLDAYEAGAHDWVAARGPTAVTDGRLDRFVAQLPPTALLADLGCGPGWYAAHLAKLGFRVVALDASAAMLKAASAQAAPTLRVVADLAALPLRRGQLDGAWAINCYSHLTAAELPLALAQLHQALSNDAPVALTLSNLSYADPLQEPDHDAEEEKRFPDDRFAGRLFTAVTQRRAQQLLDGAGFIDVQIEPATVWLRIIARRARTLPDLVRPDLRLLICGLNPSLYSADSGIPFARPGNRFWPAAKAAGLVEADRDVWAAFNSGIGFTDVVKRATARADELSLGEYASGLQRLEGLVRRYRPDATCFVGLDAWRRVVDRPASAGWIANGFAGHPAYLMPSTSGRNARIPLAELVTHLKTAATPVSRQ